MAHLIRQQLSDSMPDATGDCGDSDSQSTSFSWGGTGPLNQSGIDEVKGLSTHVARQYLSRMRKLEINTTATYGRRTSLSMLSPGGPGEGGGKMNITSIIREDDDMEDEAIRNWDSSIDLKTLPMGRPAFDPPTKVDKERKERLEKQQKASLKHPMDQYKSEVVRLSGGGIKEIDARARVAREGGSSAGR